MQVLSFAKSRDQALGACWPVVICHSFPDKLSSLRLGGLSQSQPIKKKEENPPRAGKHTGELTQKTSGPLHEQGKEEPEPSIQCLSAHQTEWK